GTHDALLGDALLAVTEDSPVCWGVYYVNLWDVQKRTLFMGPGRSGVVIYANTLVHLLAVVGHARAHQLLKFEGVDYLLLLLKFLRVPAHVNYVHCTNG
ncbi:unnamed protein product, partial [Symbiodinium necroappetens]